MKKLCRAWALSAHAFVFLSLLAVLVVGITHTAGAQTFTVVNKCSYTVYPGIYPPVYQNGGWSMAPGTSVSFAPGNLFNGRIWGRIACNSASPAQCATGSCGGTGLQCAGTTGQAGTSLAEFNLNASGTDWYDVSYVDGIDNPIGVQVSNGTCVSPSTCNSAVLTNCPAGLKSGDYCLSPCSVYNTDQFCCRNAYGTNATCVVSQWPGTDAAYVTNIHTYCPNQYAYAYDDAVGLHTCPTGSNYTITFCPGGGSGSPAPTPTPVATPIPTPSPTPIGGTSGGVSINCGGTASGSFLADTDFSGGNTASTAAAITTSLVSAPVPPQAVFQTERWGASTYTMGGFTPGITVNVSLYFAEIYWTAAGKRQFNVIINGKQVLTNFDIFAATGGENRGIQENFTTTANGSGDVVIQFTVGAFDQPKCSGITLSSAGSPAPTPVPTATPKPTAAPTATAVPTATPKATATPTATASGSTCATAWAPNTSYTAGQIVSYSGENYKCLQSHTSEVGWEPPNVPALWSPTGACH